MRDYRTATGVFSYIKGINMIDLQDIQARAWANKLEKGFNTTDVDREFNLTYGELAEAYEAYSKQKSNVGEELADVMLYLLSLAKLLNVDLEAEVERKLEKNKRRVYKTTPNGHKLRVTEGEEL
jgi:NTP pyrophosphatase (non-canonical NTP hydrolase)